MDHKELNIIEELTEEEMVVVVAGAGNPLETDSATNLMSGVLTGGNSAANATCWAALHSPALWCYGQ